MARSVFILSLLVASCFSQDYVPPGGQQDCGASGNGDPHYSGFHGQQFDFNGYPGGVFNLFSDPFINLNARFAHWGHNKNSTSTVMDAFGIHFGGHTLSVELEGYTVGEWKVTFDGMPRSVTDQVKKIILDSCFTLELRKNEVWLHGPIYEIEIIHATNVKVGQSYLNVKMNHGSEDPSHVDGVIGQTAYTNKAPSVTASDFVASSLLATDAKSNQFVAAEHDCSITPVRKHKRGSFTQPGSDQCNNFIESYELCIGKNRFDPCTSCCQTVAICQLDANRREVCVDKTTFDDYTGCNSNSACADNAICVQDLKGGGCYELIVVQDYYTDPDPTVPDDSDDGSKKRLAKQ